MKTFVILKNGIQMNTISAKDLKSAIRIAGIFTEKGVLTLYTPKDSTIEMECFTEVKHDDVFDIREMVTTKTNAVGSYAIKYGHIYTIDYGYKDRINQVVQVINTSPNITIKLI